MSMSGVVKVVLMEEGGDMVGYNTVHGKGVGGELWLEGVGGGRMKVELEWRWED